MTFPRNHSASRAIISTVLIALSAFITYANSLRIPFLFDDLEAVVENPTIRSLLPPGQLLSPPPQTTVAGRPILNLTLALCYSVSGLKVWSYHVFNILVHVGCGLLLFLTIQRVLTSPRLAARFSADARSISLCATLLWIVHPINTMCITYVIQRAESLVSFFLLATLYCSMRSLERKRPFVWSVLAVTSCGMGMGCKELMVVAPVMVVLFDYVLYFQSIRDMIRRRWPLYLGLAATWILLIALILSGPRSESAGLNLPHHRPLDYLRTQPQVLLHYLRLIIWPHPLVLDYEWPLIYRWKDAIGSLAVMFPAVILTAWGLMFRRTWSLLPGCFFLMLAPTSSFVPIVIVASEHRMYLPMATVILAILLTAEPLLTRFVAARARRPLVAIGITALCAVLAWRTHERNKVYRDGVTTWADVVEKRPQNPRAHMNLAANLHARGQTDDALTHLNTAIRLLPAYADAHYNLGTVLADLGRLDEATNQFRETIRLKPAHATAHYNLGHALVLQGRHDEAVAILLRAVELKRDHAQARADLGVTLALLGRVDEAVPHLREAVRLDGKNASTLNTLAWILATHPRDDLRDGAEALRLALHANRLLGERDPAGLDTLAAAYAESGRFEDALATIDRAIDLAAQNRLDPLIAEFHERRARYVRRAPHRDTTVISPAARSAASARP